MKFLENLKKRKRLAAIEQAENFEGADTVLVSGNADCLVAVITTKRAQYRLYNDGPERWVHQETGNYVSDRFVSRLNAVLTAHRYRKGLL